MYFSEVYYNSRKGLQLTIIKNMFSRRKEKRERKKESSQDVPAE